MLHFSAKMSCLAACFGGLPVGNTARSRMVYQMADGLQGWCKYYQNSTNKINVVMDSTRILLYWGSVSWLRNSKGVL